MKAALTNRQSERLDFALTILVRQSDAIGAAVAALRAVEETREPARLAMATAMAILAEVAAANVEVRERSMIEIRARLGIEADNVAEASGENAPGPQNTSSLIPATGHHEETGP